MVRVFHFTTTHLFLNLFWFLHFQLPLSNFFHLFMSIECFLGVRHFPQQRASGGFPAKGRAGSKDECCRQPLVEAQTILRALGQHGRVRGMRLGTR